MAASAPDTSLDRFRFRSLQSGVEVELFAHSHEAAEALLPAEHEWKLWAINDAYVCSLCGQLSVQPGRCPDCRAYGEPRAI